MKQILPVALVLGLLGCSSSAEQPGNDDVVARIGDREITLGEIEQRWKEEDPARHAQALQQVYDGRRKALDGIVAEILLAEAAEQSGMSAAAYAEAEISKRVRPITDQDVQSFYQANVNDMPGSLQEMAPLIYRFLEEQSRATARAQVVAELRKAGPALYVSLEAPRHTIGVEPTDPVNGPASAPVTIVEFSDFQCPYCRQASPTLKKLRADYGDQIRIVWKDFPLTQIHPEAFKAAEAAHCAGEQDRFWEYHDRLFANQQALQEPALKTHAAEIQLDMARFNECLDSSRFADRVRAGVQLGTSLGVSATPTIYVNGRLFSGAHPYETLAAAIDEELGE